MDGGKAGERDQLLLSKSRDFYYSMEKDEESQGVMDEEAVHLMEDPSPTPRTKTGSRQTRSLTPSGKRRRPIRLDRTMREDPSSSFMLRLICLCVLTLMVIGSLGVLTYYMQDSQPSKFQRIPGGSEVDELQSLSDGAVVDLVRGGAYSLSSQDAVAMLRQDLGLKPDTLQRPLTTVRYDPKITQYNPFEFQDSQVQPLAPLLTESIDDLSSLGYIQMPHLVQNQLVFCSQGDVFTTRIDPKNPSKPLSAARLTTTIGNVLDPRLHPTLRYVAYTATYSGRRDIYLLDLHGGKAAVRLTYWDASVGVSGLVGWWGTSALVFRALSNDISLPDTRLYVLHLEDNDETLRARDVEELADITPVKEASSSITNDPRAVSMLQIDPIPLSQAREAARYVDCWYFVRYSQSSHTIRYVGGTAEQLYRYCDGASMTDRLISHDQYNGTSKAPQMYTDTKYLFFLSDRGRHPNGSWQPDRMNVWALSLSTNIEEHTADALIQITDTSCDFEGRVIQEYSVDPSTGHMVLRIGADLYWMTASDIQQKLNGGGRQLSEDFDFFSSDSDDNSTEAVPGEVPIPVGTAVSDDNNIEPVPDGVPIPGGAAVGDENSSEPVPDGVPIAVGVAVSDVNSTAPVPDAVPIAVGIDDEIDATNVDVEELNQTEPQVYYDYESPELVSRFVVDTKDHFSGSSTELSRLPIVVHSDFDSQQERIIPLDVLSHLTSADVYETALGSLSFIATFRGQLWVLPVVEDSVSSYGGAGRNIPERRYRVAPGATMGGAVRILAVVHVPNPVEDDTSDRRLAVILATDPLSETAEHAFYLIETQSGVSPLFLDMERLPKPFLGGHLSAGSTKEGGLGSVEPGSVQVSPCGRRMAWTDRDGRIVVMNLPHYQDMTNRELPEVVVLPQENELGEPMVGDTVDLVWSPGGRYLAVQHNARNQFSIISIIDLGDPQGEDKVADISVGRIVQATPSRFNSMSPYWSKSIADMRAHSRDAAVATLLGSKPPSDAATALFYLSDRDIVTDVRSPWGNRQPMPHFKQLKSIFALPLYPKNSTASTEGPYGGGGATEARIESILARQQTIKTVLSTSRQSRGLLRDSLAGAFGLADDVFAARRALDVQHKLETESDEPPHDEGLRTATFPVDLDVDFGEDGDRSLNFARQSYRLATIPEGNYVEILSHTPDNGSFSLIAIENDKAVLMVYLSDGFPSDVYTSKTFSPVGRKLASYGRSTCGAYLYFTFSPDGQTRVVENSGIGLSMLLLDTELDDDIASASGLFLSVWPTLEYRQLYDDAWRMLRDYYYDAELTGIDWPAVHGRYLSLLSRCAKREELDDVLVQLASELSALHVFVYGGEKDSPVDGKVAWSQASDVASLGATFKRAPEWKGYEILSIAESDPDFGLIDGSNEIYSPLSDKTLRLSGQKGLMPGDVIVGVNGNSVLNVPDIHMLLRGQAKSSVRLEVLRLASGDLSSSEASHGEVPVEPVIVVPIDSTAADNLRYYAWEWKTRLLADQLAAANGFSVGYIHLQDMSGPQAENAFARGFFPNYHKEALILDVRHNRGGNIDSWVLDVLQRKAWMYWESRDFTADNGGLGWDEQYAFRGHIVVLVDEKTSSDGEGVARGISELGLGRLIGTRTWGGGIWLASDNHLVDGGIATAPEIGTYNEKFGWGLGIEQMGVRPDLEVDNDPHQSYDGKDTQLETAILELKKWLLAEPIVMPKPPERKRDMTMGDRECPTSS
jgi:C-terminal processing protease CtpA/Prc